MNNQTEDKMHHFCIFLYIGIKTSAPEMTSERMSGPSIRGAPTSIRLQSSTQQMMSRRACVRDTVYKYELQIYNVEGVSECSIIYHVPPAVVRTVFCGQKPPHWELREWYIVNGKWYMQLFFHLLCHQGIDDSHGGGVHDVTNRAFDIGEVDGLVQSHLDGADNLSVATHGLNELVG